MRLFHNSVEYSSKRATVHRQRDYGEINAEAHMFRAESPKRRANGGCVATTEFVAGRDCTEGMRERIECWLGYAGPRRVPVG